MRRRRLMYMHTRGGQPATYEATPWPALMLIMPPTKDYPRACGALVASLRTITRQQVAAAMALPASLRATETARFGYVRIEVFT